MCSGLTSASSASKAFASNFVEAFDLTIGEGAGLTALALGFMTLVALINFRGVGDPRLIGVRLGGYHDTHEGFSTVLIAKRRYSWAWRMRVRTTTR